MPAVRIAVPAKVNLHLAVGKKRRDGYHSVRTLLHTVGLWDEILISAAPAFSFTATGYPVPRGPGNLCVRAYAILRGRAEKRPAARIHLVKRIPPAAGLGGGSADAAACLRGLDAFWRLGLRREELAGLARRLGSDVPFFLTGGAAIGTGRGDRLSPVPSRLRAWAVILKPGYPGRTTAAYRSLDRQRAAVSPAAGATLKEARQAVRRGSLARLNIRNDFTQQAAKRHPRTGVLLAALLKSGAVSAFLAGSGSAVAGLTANRTLAQKIARKAARDYRVRARVAALRPLKMRIGPA